MIARSPPTNVLGNGLLGMSVFSVKQHGFTCTHTQIKRGVYTVDSVSGDHSCGNWGKKLGQGRCRADINNSVEMVRARGWGMGGGGVVG